MFYLVMIEADAVQIDNQVAVFKDVFGDEVASVGRFLSIKPTTDPEYDDVSRRRQST